jgi:hypothetical protein
MAVRLDCWAAVLIAGLVLCLPANSDSADSSKLAARGKAILQAMIVVAVTFDAPEEAPCAFTLQPRRR